MTKILIDLNDFSNDDIAQLKLYLEYHSWDWKELTMVSTDSSEDIYADSESTEILQSKHER
jgi:hypothetical protein